MPAAITELWLGDELTCGALKEAPPDEPPPGLRALIAARYQVPLGAVGEPEYVAVDDRVEVQRRAVDLATDHVQRRGGALVPCILVEAVVDLAPTTDDPATDELRLARGLRTRVHYVVRRPSGGGLECAIPLPYPRALVVPVAGLDVRQRYTRAQAERAYGSIAEMIEENLVDLEAVMCKVRLAHFLQHRRGDLIRLFLAHADELGPIAQHSSARHANIARLARNQRWCWAARDLTHPRCREGQVYCDACMDV